MKGIRAVAVANIMADDTVSAHEQIHWPEPALRSMAQPQLLVRVAWQALA